MPSCALKVMGPADTQWEKMNFKDLDGNLGDFQGLCWLTPKILITLICDMYLYIYLILVTLNMWCVFLHLLNSGNSNRWHVSLHLLNSGNSNMWHVSLLLKVDICFRLWTEGICSTESRLLRPWQLLHCGVGWVLCMDKIRCWSLAV